MKPAMKKNTFLILLILLPICVIAQDARSPENQAFITAKGIYDDGLYKIAADQLRSFVSKYPNSRNISLARYLLGESYFQLKKYKEAISQYQTLMQTAPALQYREQTMYRIGE